LPFSGSKTLTNVVAVFPDFFRHFFQPPCEDREDVEEGGAVQAVQVIHYQASQLFALGCDVHGCCLLVLTTKENQREKQKRSSFYTTAYYDKLCLKGQ
jgi:hypothetical protein